MENKSTESTPQRPQGGRIISAPLIEMDLNNFIAQIKQETTWVSSDRNSITIFKSEEIRIVLIGLHDHAELKTHTANGITSVQVLEGQINFTAEQQTITLGKGQMIVLQEKSPHSIIALKESFFLLTMAMTASPATNA